MVKPPTLILLLSYGIFFAAWDAQAATALSLSGLRADFHASVDDRHREEPGSISISDHATTHASSTSRRGFARNAAYSIAQSLRSLFQQNLFAPPTPSQTGTISLPQGASHLQVLWGQPGFHDLERRPNAPSARPLPAQSTTDLPSFLLTASSALRFQHRLRIA
ncbi:hypothetical protein FEM03_16740 [Phragmitibacter flavus]|uniref:Uncharacterized protein n=1 Tax=Phragmitibacter flavus TaxID=2576071 RepID=A0A5R8KCE8_9BACT|nr:hypothetical protein [Phragmitibacter flavus]TLD69605.1 hypothetical protein FEM03_16740 [Phragmitibacter flavus]